MECVFSVLGAVASGYTFTHMVAGDVTDPCERRRCSLFKTASLRAPWSTDKANDNIPAANDFHTARACTTRRAKAFLLHGHVHGQRAQRAIQPKRASTRLYRQTTSRRHSNRRQPKPCVFAARAAKPRKSSTLWRLYHRKRLRDVQTRHAQADAHHVQRRDNIH